VTHSIEQIRAYEPQTPQDVQQHPHHLVNHSERFLQHNRKLKDFLFQNMYYSFRIVRMAKRAEHFITEIFNSYLKEPRQLPPEYQAKLGAEATHRVVADYIASMTDRGALLEYRRLFDPLTKP
jgi:dGTPase